METTIICRRVHVTPATGHITIRVQSKTTHESATWLGHAKDYGVDVELFRGRFNSSIEQLKTYIASQHRAMIGVHTGLVEELTKLEGQEIG